MDFDHIVIDLDDLFDFLKNSEKQPVVETDLLKAFFPDYDEVMKYGGVNLDTFKMHFVLYHYLYKLSGKLRCENYDYQIYIKYIYIHLLKKPLRGFCQFFNEELEQFCCEKITEKYENENYCDYHIDLEIKSRDKLCHKDISHYYLNFDNYYLMNEDDLNNCMENMYGYLRSKDLVEQSLDTLSLPVNSSFDKIKERFKHLSKKYHPDLNKDEQTEDKFKKINSAYQVLKDYHSK